MADTKAAESRRRWDPSRRAQAYSELEHPTDIFLEVYGRDLLELLGNALFAFYDQVAEVEGFQSRRELTLRVRERGLDEALRALLSEALYRFDTERFVAVGGDVTFEGPSGPPARTCSDGEGGVAGDSRDPDRAAHGAATAARGDRAAGGEWCFSARLWGDNADRDRHVLLHEIKAVTYHRLAVTQSDTGWKATVLLDI